MGAGVRDAGVGQQIGNGDCPAGGGANRRGGPPLTLPRAAAYGARPPSETLSSQGSSVSRRDPAGSRSSSSARGKGAGAKARADGKVDVSCPQCGVQYRLAADALEEKIECGDCHRVFLPKTTVGKRVKPPDYTKVYVGFGIGIVALIGIFILASREPDKPKPPPAPVAPVHTVGRGDHPRTAMLVKWAQAFGGNGELILATHSDAAAIGKELGLKATDTEGILKEMVAHDSAEHLRAMVCDSGTLLTEEDMKAPTGKAKVYLTPKGDDPNYKKNTRCEIEVSFRMEGQQVLVTGFKTTLPPIRGKGWLDPKIERYVPNKDIARPDEKQITDSAGTRKVRESQPAAVPHWAKATPAQQKLADDTVALLLQASDPAAPGNLFNKATMSVREVDDKKAVVPRVLNAMFELYSDVNANNLKLVLLDKALQGWTGFAVNYTVLDSGDPAKDKAERESCIRQWFAFWYRYANGELKEFIEEEDTLEVKPKEDPNQKKPAK